MGGRTSNESKAKYNSKTYDRVNLAIPKGQKSDIKVEADKVGQSLNAYITQAIIERMERDKAGESGGKVARS